MALTGRGALTRRRLLAGAAATVVSFGCAQPELNTVLNRSRRIGLLTSGPTPPPAQMAAFHAGMKDEGLLDGADYVVEVRATDGRADRLVGSAVELLGLGLDLLLVTTTGSAQAARAVTSKVPIVMVAAHDPVEAGIVTSLDRPGGNVTGQSLLGVDLIPRQLEILREVMPVRRLAYLTPTLPSPADRYPSVTDMFARAMRSAADAMGIQAQTYWMTDRTDIEDVVSGMTTEAVDGMFVIESPIWFAAQGRRPIDRLADLALGRQLPSIGGARIYAESGLLMSYGDARRAPELFKGVSRFVARILRGADPADIPVEGPSRLELVVNTRMAAAAGISIPKMLLDRADVLIR